jgi:hypothetical protein
MADLGQEEVRNPTAYLRKIIRGLIHEDISSTLRSLDPAASRRYLATQELLKQLELQRPEASSEDLEEEAMRIVNELANLHQWLDRVPFELAKEAASPEDLSKRVLGKLLLDLVELLVNKSPFTETDLDTWKKWRAVDFSGNDIDWAASDVKSTTGSQRLLALKTKLRTTLSDLGYPGL